MPGSSEQLLQIDHLKTHFDAGRAHRHAVVRAVDGITLVVRRGEALGLVGESGSGKSTLARTVIRLDTPTEGRVVFDGVDIARLSSREMRPFRRRVQMVFQDPYASLNPRMRVGDIVGEPLIVHEGADRGQSRRRASELLERVGLPADCGRRYPHEFSGGQRQRIGIARALAVRPDLIVLDEPVSALDVSIRSQLLNLLKSLQRDYNLTYLLISHDLGVVRHVCDRVAVMYLGQVVEEGVCEEVFSNPQHPYTQALIAAIPVPDPAVERHREGQILSEEMPSPLAPPPGCRFHTRCPVAMPECAESEPPAITISEDHWAACLRATPDDVSTNSKHDQRP
jgi:oligopeptide transport system ATP-binding protein